MKQKSGFTLVELLVSMSVFVLLASVTLVNMRSSETSKQLRFAAQEVVSQLERMRNYSQTGVLQAGSVPEGGYGLFFEYGADSKTGYSLFADQGPVPNRRMDAGEAVGTAANLPSAIYFASFSGSASPANIVFTAPYGDIWVNGVQPTGNIILELRAKGKSDTQTITVNIQNHTIDY